MKRIILLIIFCLLSLTCHHIKPFKSDYSFVNEPPTYESVYKLCVYYQVKYPEIVCAQAILETGHFTSKNCKIKNNLFGLYDSKNRKYYEFDHWAHSIIAYKNKIQYKYKGGDYYKFLNRIGYATDPSYINKLKEIQRS